MRSLTEDKDREGEEKEERREGGEEEDNERRRSGRYDIELQL